jgi:hypothetical protein
MINLTFTENDIQENANRLTGFDARNLPRVSKNSPERTGKCVTCGGKCYPYYTCRKCREITTVRNVLNDLVDEGLLIRKTDGRGRKGGATYAKKPVNPLVRFTEKAKPNDICSCGSLLKFKKCCMGKSNIDSQYSRMTTQPKQEQLTLDANN